MTNHDAVEEGGGAARCVMRNQLAGNCYQVITISLGIQDSPFPRDCVFTKCLMCFPCSGRFCPPGERALPLGLLRAGDYNSPPSVLPPASNSSCCSFTVTTSPVPGSVWRGTRLAFGWDGVGFKSPARPLIHYIVHLVPHCGSFAHTRLWDGYFSET